MIIAFHLQNQPYVGLPGGTCGSNVDSDTAAADWVCKRARFIRHGLLGVGSPIKIATGGLGGSVGNGCSFLTRAMQCPALDVVARPS